MAIEDILHTLEVQADQEVARISEEASAHAAHVIAEAELDAERLREEYIAQAERIARSEAARSINAARMNARRAVLAARDAGVESVYEAVQGRLAQIREGSEYPELFGELARDALDGMTGDIIVRVVSGDETLAEAALARAGVKAEIRGDLDASGGVVVMSADGRIARRNSLEDRLEQARRIARARVAEALYA